MRRRFGLLLAAMAAALTAAGGDVPKPGCALLKACGLEVALARASCIVDQSQPISGVAYDAQRCAEPRDLIAHGVDPLGSSEFAVFTFLGGRYRIAYELKGSAPISVARFDFLANDLPLAAKLATRFSKTAYVIRNLDADQSSSRRFHASRADKLTGEARRLFADFSSPLTGDRRVYFGSGVSKFGPWKLRGSAYVEIRVKPHPVTPGRIEYQVRIRTAPINAMVNAIMKLGIFKGMVTGQIEDTMKDLIGASGALSAQGVEAVLKDPAFTHEERLKIQTLAALP